MALAGNASRQRSIAPIPVILSRCFDLPFSLSLSVSRRGRNLRLFVLTVPFESVRLNFPIIHPQLLVPVGMGGRLIILDLAARKVDLGLSVLAHHPELLNGISSPDKES